MKATFILCLLFLLWNLDSNSLSNFKELKIKGLKIHSELHIIELLNLKKLQKKKNHFKFLEGKINALYHKRGYTLAKTFLIEETEDKIIIFVDEGRLNRIIFLRLNSIDTLKMKYDFKLKHKIYNKYIIEKETERIKKKYNFKDIHVILQPIKEYDDSLFQLDDEFDLPLLGETRLPFFAKFGQSHDLVLYFLSHPITELRSRSFGFGFRTSYSRGLIPYLKYIYPSCITRRDLLVVGTSMGIRYGLYGLNLNFSKPPQWSFMKAHSDYFFTPIFKRYFTPVIRGLVHNSRASRHDLGLTEYKFLKLRGTVVPGITLLNKLKIYAGYGGERVYIRDPVVDEDAADPQNIERHVDNWGFFETRLVLHVLPWTLKRTKKKKLELIYSYYMNNERFHELIFKGEADFELESLNIYSVTITFAKIWRYPPFYHEVSVSSPKFKGFMGKNYYTRRMASNSNEYRISIYKDSIYFGIYTDLIWFEGSGYDLFDNQYGIASGIAGHIIFLDQFEFNIYYGKDYLLSSGESQYNLYMKARKKW